jgi:hypothetical protein
MCFIASSPSSARDDDLIDYVVTGIIPFLVNYFGKYYNRKDATMYAPLSSTQANKDA